MEDLHRELARKVVHMGVGILALALPYLGPSGSLLLFLALAFFNAVVLPRVGGRLLWREHELERESSPGILAYPVMLALLVLLFWKRLEVVSAVWGILAFGDGLATVAGVLLGRRKLPWNEAKTWAGSAAFWVGGSAASAILLIWTSRHLGREEPWPWLVLAASIATLAAAWVESQPQGLDDNVTIPVPAALVLLGLLQSPQTGSAGLPVSFGAQLATGLALNVVLAALAWNWRAVDRSGAVAGAALGALIYGALGGAGFVMLGAFLVLGTAVTRLGYERKAAARLAEAREGRRGARNALANAGVATVAAIFAATTPHVELYTLAFAAALATAAGDTASSEVGQLSRGRTILITRLRPVRPGADGGVSLLGSVAGLAGSATIATLGWMVGLYSAGAVPIVALAGLVGTFVDSVLGATLERRALLDNQGVNFASTLAGAVMAALWVY